MNWYLKSLIPKIIGVLKSGMPFGPSPIHGNGIFAPRKFNKGERVFIIARPHPAREDECCRTEATRLTNHCSNPNLVPMRHGKMIIALAKKPISPGDECTVDYRDIIPEIMKSPKIIPNSIFRETDGIDDILKDQDGITLQDQLRMIQNGEYN